MRQKRRGQRRRKNSSSRKRREKKKKRRRIRNYSDLHNESLVAVPGVGGSCGQG